MNMRKLKNDKKLFKRCCLYVPAKLSENPNAPAQGALAAEIKSSRQDIREIISTLTIQK